MIPEKGSLFLCDWSIIKEKHHVKKDNINDCFRIIHMVTVKYLCHIHSNSGGEEMRLHEKRARFPLKLMFFFCGLTLEVMHAGEKAKQTKSTSS